MKRTINDVFDDNNDIVVDTTSLVQGCIGELEEPGSSSSAGNVVTFNRTSQLSVPLPYSVSSNSNSVFCGINWNSLGGGDRSAANNGGSASAGRGGDDVISRTTTHVAGLGCHHPKRQTIYHHSEVSTPADSIASSEGRLPGGVDVNVLTSKIEALTLKELNALSHKQREVVYEDVHGVSDFVQETPELVQDHLEKLNVELNRLVQDPSKNTTAYEQAKRASAAGSSLSESSSNNEFLLHQNVQSEPFQLIFLRAALFDVQVAAEKIIAYFFAKLELWGPNLLLKSISYDDFDQDDLTVLESGCFQVLPENRDRSGRAVVISMRNNDHHFKSWKNFMRTVWYLYMNALQNDVEVQRRGMAYIIYELLSISSRIPKYLMQCLPKMYIIDAIPVRWVSFHYCFDNPIMKYTMAVLKGGLNSTSRQRFRSHFGTSLEIQYALQAYGISQYILPLDANGHLIKTRHFEYLEQRKQLERKERAPSSTFHPIIPARVTSTNLTDSAGGVGSSDVIDSNDPATISPKPNDVLLGKGKQYQHHAGNIYLTELVEKHRAGYSNAQTQIEKTCIIQLIVKMIQERNGRFLQRDNKKQMWVDLPTEAAWTRVGRRFRK